MANKAGIAACLVTVGLSIAGCGVGNAEKDFLCGADTGLPCRSISEVDGTALGSGSTVTEDQLDTQNKQLSQKPLLAAGKKGTVLVGPPAGGTPYVSGRYRIPEKTGKLWIAPHLDEAKVLHEGTYVHFVLREARWGAR